MGLEDVHCIIWSNILDNGHLIRGMIAGNGSILFRRYEGIEL